MLDERSVQTGSTPFNIFENKGNVVEMLNESLRAILQESEAKLEMKIFNPLHFLCGGRLPGGMNKNSHIWIGRCVIAMETALDHVGLRSIF